MGASKVAHYSKETINLSLIARALAHPARIQMVKYLKENNACSGVEFTSILRLSKSAVFDHIEKLKDANLVRVDYFPHYYSLTLIPENIEELSGFITN